MKALDRKLWRDLRLMWSQALTIALVVASGVAGFITSLSAVDSLALARDRFYADGRFADLFAAAKRAPDALAEVLRADPGVTDVQTTIEEYVRIELPDTADPVIGQLIGLDARRPMRMNLVSLQRGRWPEPGLASDATIPALVSAGFAQARGLRPGMQVRALINGKQRSLRIEGIALSPEFVFAGLAGMPDLRGFGIFWIDHDALAAAYDMAGAFNRVAVKLAPGASEADVAARLADRLAPYGTRNVIGRADQTSNLMLDNEVKEQQVLGSVVPAIFLGVAAFLLNVVVSRLVATQREQIAALKALGYPNRRIAVHYLQMVMVIVTVGVALGLLLGNQLGEMFTGLYAEFFFFPGFRHHLAPGLAAAAVGVAFATGVLGTLNALWATVRLAPAEAMRPPAPGRYRRTLVERLGITGLPTGLRMILRQMERRPWRSVLSIGGVAAAVAIVVLGNFFRDAIGFISDVQFNLVLRGDVIVALGDPMDASAAAHGLARLPGVTEVEPARIVSARLSYGHRQERVAIQGLAAAPSLRRIIDLERRQTRPDAEGLVLTDRLAAKLGLRVGDTVRVETLDGERRELSLPVSATVAEMMGLNAYMERRALSRALGEGDLANQMMLAVERGREAELLEASKAVPRVASAFSKATMWRNMQEITARNIRIMSTVLTSFAAVIAIGVVYNNARIALAERSWELASLRVLGFSRAEVSALLLGEMAIAIAIALPLGMLLGRGLVGLISQMLKSDQFMFPVVILAPTYLLAALAVLVAGAGSALVVRRRIDRLDMVAALKTRE